MNTLELIILFHKESRSLPRSILRYLRIIEKNKFKDDNVLFFREELLDNTLEIIEGYNINNNLVAI
jgi:hypothetical protein